MTSIFSRIGFSIVSLGWVSVSFGQVAHSTSSPDAPTNSSVGDAAQFEPLQQAIDQIKHAKNLEPSHLQDQQPKSCMENLWQGVLPFVAKRSYITAEDMERLTGVKMQEKVDIAPNDTVATYEDNGAAHLSIRVEVMDKPSSYTWQVSQGRTNPGNGSTSIVDFSCMGGPGGLQLSKLEVDLSLLGFHKIGFTAQEVHAEYFLGKLGSVAVFFELPVESVPTVDSLHIVGSSNDLAAPSSKQSNAR
jgi:hypothetical protein